MSSRSSNTSKDWRDFTSTEALRLAGTIRRMAVKITNILKNDGATGSSFWQLLGHLLLDNTTQETADAEVFSGVGFYARPPADANAEAIVAFPGGPSNPVVVASRDEATRNKVAGAALQDETYVFNSKVAIRFTASGLIQAYLVVGGAAPVALALKSDVDAVVSAFNAHTHVETGTTTNAVTVLQRAPAAIGSSVLRG